MRLTADSMHAASSSEYDKREISLSDQASLAESGRVWPSEKELDGARLTSFQGWFRS
jgi:hypothetical protein